MKISFHRKHSYMYIVVFYDFEILDTLIGEIFVNLREIGFF